MQTTENSEKRVVEIKQIKLNSHYKQIKTSDCWKPWKEGSKSNAANYSLCVEYNIFWKSSSQNAHPLLFPPLHTDSLCISLPWSPHCLPANADLEKCTTSTYGGSAIVKLVSHFHFLFLHKELPSIIVLYLILPTIIALHWAAAQLYN